MILLGITSGKISSQHLDMMNLSGNVLLHWCILRI